MLECRTLRSGRVMASWTDQEGQINPSALIRHGLIKFFFVNTIKFEEDQYKRHVFSGIQWYKEDSQKEYYRRPVDVWKPKSFVQPGPSTFMPV